MVIVRAGLFIYWTLCVSASETREKKGRRIKLRDRGIRRAENSRDAAFHDAEIDSSRDVADNACHQNSRAYESLWSDFSLAPLSLSSPFPLSLSVRNHAKILQNSTLETE